MLRQEVSRKLMSVTSLPNWNQCNFRDECAEKDGKKYFHPGRCRYHEQLNKRRTHAGNLSTDDASTASVADWEHN